MKDQLLKNVKCIIFIIHLIIYICVYYIIGIIVYFVKKVEKNYFRLKKKLFFVL